MAYHRRLYRFPLFASLIFTAMIAAPAAQAALTLTVDVFNETTLSFTVAGTLDATTEGDFFPGQFVIAGDPQGLTEFIDSSASFEAFGMILIGGVEAGYTITTDPLYGHAFVFFTEMSSPVTAGTEVSGSMTVNGGYTAFPLLSLWSGGDFDGVSVTSNRLEAVAVPEPSSIGLSCLLGGALLLRRQRR